MNAQSAPAPSVQTPALDPCPAANLNATCDLKTILVPTDFSAPAEKAVEYAAALGRQFHSKIILLHAIEPIYALDCYTGYADTVDTFAISARLREATLKLRERGLQAGDSIVVNGVGWDAIVRAASQVKADLIVIATHGYTGLTHALLGSTAERVVRHAACPVLVVREREREFVK